MKNTFLLIGSLLFVWLAGCQSQPVQQHVAQPAMPGWILNPGNGAVGSSVIHVKGVHFQKQLAVSRARQELAARQGVDVEYIQMSTETVNNQNAYTKVKRVGSEEVSTKTVKARVTQTWQNPNTREIFVLVEPIN